MRWYKVTVETAGGGLIVNTIDKLSTNYLRFIVNTPSDLLYNPNIPESAYKEQALIELYIRENNLRG